MQDQSSMAFCCAQHFYGQKDVATCMLAQNVNSRLVFYNVNRRWKSGKRK